MKHFFCSNKNNPWFLVFICILVVSLCAMLMMSKDAGNSGDEDGSQIPQGKNIVNYFKTNGADTTCMTFSNLKYYGSSPDVIAEYWNQTFKVENIHQSRHTFFAFYGWIALLFAGLIAYLIGGWRAATITVLLLFFSPRFLGHSLNNPKDIPFAAALTAGIYFIMLFFKQFPKVKIYTFIGLIFFIAFAISVRIGGVMLVAYFGLFGIIYLMMDHRKNRVQGSEFKVQSSKLKVKSSKVIVQSSNFKFQSLKTFRMLIYGLGIAIVSFFLGILLWPFALQSPINNTFAAFSEMSSFSLSIRQLFEGTLQWSNRLPWYYTPKFILITIPIDVLVGLILFFIFIRKDKKNYFNYFIIFFSFFFPIFWIVYTNANVYGGWRHSLFAYPPMVIAAALGFNLVIEWIAKKTTKITLISIIAMGAILLLWNPIRHIVLNHPYEYIYFNELEGGTKNAYGNYEMDYYYNSTREASEWLIANAQKSGLENGDKIIVLSWHTASVQYFLRNDTADFQVVYSRWDRRSEKDWDYAIFPITGMMPEEIKNVDFPPKNTVFQVKVDEKPICLVLKRETKDDFIGAQLKSNKEYAAAIPYLTNALKSDPTNISIYMNLIETFYNLGKLDSAKFYIDQILEYTPKFSPANFALANYYYNTGDAEKALKTLKVIRQNNIQFTESYQLTFQIYTERKDYINAEKVLLEYLAIGKFETKVFNQLVELYRVQGLNERSANKKAFIKFADMFEKFGKKEEAQQYRDAARKL